MQRASKGAQGYPKGSQRVPQDGRQSDLWSSWEGFVNDFLTFVWSSWECFGVTWDSLVAHRRSVLRGYFLKKTLNKFKKKVGFWRCCSGRGWLSEACRSILPQIFLRKLSYGAKIRTFREKGNNYFLYFFPIAPLKGYI